MGTSSSGDTTPCRMTGVTLHSHVLYKETYVHTRSELLFSSVNNSTPMHMVVCGASTSGALPQRPRGLRFLASEAPLHGLACLVLWLAFGDFITPPSCRFGPCEKSIALIWPRIQIHSRLLYSSSDQPTWVIVDPRLAKRILRSNGCLL